MGSAELCHSAVRAVGKVPKKAERCVLEQESRVTSNTEESGDSVRSPVRQLSKTSAIKCSAFLQSLSLGFTSPCPVMSRSIFVIQTSEMAN